MIANTRDNCIDGGSMSTPRVDNAGNVRVAVPQELLPIRYMRLRLMGTSRRIVLAEFIPITIITW